MGRWFTGCLSVLAILVVAKAYTGWHQARTDAPDLIVEAASLIAQGRGAHDLGPGRVEQVLATQDPNFFRHNGVDLKTRGPATDGTVTQTLARPVSIASMVPGVGKVSRLTYTLALDERLPKTAQLALFLDRVDMGHAPDGTWIIGFFKASEVAFDRSPAELTDDEFRSLVAAMGGGRAISPTAAPTPSRVAYLGVLRD